MKARRDAAAANPMEQMEDDPVEIGTWAEEELTEAALKKAIDSLNTEQRKYFDECVTEIQNRIEDALLDGGDARIDLNLFITGFAGTGKSKLIEVLAKYIHSVYRIQGFDNVKPAVLICAPTGIAAVNIKGNTIHSLLKIEVEHERTAPLKVLNPMQLSKMDVFFKNVKMLIVDEISMVSNILLLKVHHRLQQIKKNEKIFGGVFTVVFGDFFQLPPVRLLPCFCDVKNSLVRQIFRCMPVEINVWKDVFEYRELTINMRQQEDLAYSDVLNRIRIGSPLDEDYIKLMNRCISQIKKGNEWNKGDPIPPAVLLDEAVDYYIDLVEHVNKHNMNGEKKRMPPLAVFGYTNMVSKFNDAVLKRLNPATMTFTARDSIFVMSKNRIGKFQKLFLRRHLRRKDLGKGQLRKPEQTKLPEDAKKCGGLPGILTLSLGSRVMLSRNVKTASGLANEALGTVTGTDISPFTGQITGIIVKFDHLPEPVVIKKTRAVFDVAKQSRAARVQFPLTLAYSMTIHKCQGVTADDVIIDLYSLFTEGQAYVACSRVRNLQGVHLLGIHPAAIKTSALCVKEYNRLRELNKLGPLEGALKPPEIIGIFPPRIKDWRHVFTGDLQPRKKDVIAKKLPKKRSAPRKSQKKGKSEKRKKVSTKKAKGRGKRQQKEMVTTEDDIVQPFRSPDSPVELLPPSDIIPDRQDPKPYHNTGTDCFLISAVNLINQIPELKHELVNCPDEQLQQLCSEERSKNYNITVQLKKALMTPTAECHRQNLSDLRQVLPDHFSEGHKSVSKAMESLPERFLKSCVITSLDIPVCPTCKAANDVPTTDYRTLHMFPIRKGNNQLEEVIQQHAARSRVRLDKAECFKCNGRGLEREIQYKFGQDFKYLLAVGNWELGNDPITNKHPIRGYRRQGNQFFGETWKLVAYSQHLPNVGHFVTWIVKPAGGCIVIDDNREIEHRTRMNAGLSGFQIAVFQRISNTIKMAPRYQLPAITEELEVDDNFGDIQKANNDENELLQPEVPAFDAPVISSSLVSRPLGIRNLGNTCYANSGIQIFGHLWKLSLLNQDWENPFWRNRYAAALQQILTRPDWRGAESLLLLEGFPETYRNFNRQQSAAEFINFLIEYLPGGLTIDLRHNHIPIYECLLCGRREQGQSELHFTLPLGAPPGRYECFPDFVRTYTQRKEMEEGKTCEECRIRHPENRNLWYKVKHMEERQIIIPSTCQFLAVEMSPFVRDWRSRKTIRKSRSIANPLAPSKLFGHLWKPTAAIWHVGNTADCGHYKAFVELNGIWFECNDNEIIVSSFPPLMEGLVFVILRKIDDVPCSNETYVNEANEIEIEQPMPREEIAHTHGKPMETEEPLQLEEEDNFAGTVASLSQASILSDKSFVLVNMLIFSKYAHMDMYKSKCDGILNAANNRLMPGGGVDKLMRQAAGPRLTRDTTELVKKFQNSILPPGEVVITNSYGLRTKGFKKIIHAAAPELSRRGAKISDRDVKNLHLSYLNTFKKANEAKLRSCVCPIIGSGIFNWEKDTATAIAVQAAFQFFKSTKNKVLRKIVIAEPDKKNFDGILKTVTGSKSSWQMKSSKQATAVSEELVGNVKKKTLKDLMYKLL